MSTNGHLYTLSNSLPLDAAELQLGKLCQVLLDYLAINLVTDALEGAGSSVDGHGDPVLLGALFDPYRLEPSDSLALTIDSALPSHLIGDLSGASFR